MIYTYVIKNKYIRLDSNYILRSNIVGRELVARYLKFIVEFYKWVGIIYNIPKCE